MSIQVLFDFSTTINENIISNQHIWQSISQFSFLSKYNTYFSKSQNNFSRTFYYTMWLNNFNSSRYSDKRRKFNNWILRNDIVIWILLAGVDCRNNLIHEHHHPWELALIIISWQLGACQKSSTPLSFGIPLLQKKASFSTIISKLSIPYIYLFLFIEWGDFASRSRGSLGNYSFYLKARVILKVPSKHNAPDSAPIKYEKRRIVSLN